MWTTEYLPVVHATINFMFKQRQVRISSESTPTEDA